METKTFVFGTLPGGETVTAGVLKNKNGMSVTVLNYGATIQSLCVPDRNGVPVDVVLGYDTAAEYAERDAYLGATIGRVGNRIGGAEFSLNGTTHRLAKNDGDNHLHGGVRGFDKHLWDLTVVGDSILCERLSPDGEEGYPGNLSVKVLYTLTDDDRLILTYDACSDRDTLVNLTNHSYFNLAGEGTILDHLLQVNAERFCEGDEGCLPTGQLLPVNGTPFDFRTAKKIGKDIEADDVQLKRAGGYDHNFCLSGKRAAVLSSEATGIEMTVETDLPGLQVYSGNFLNEHPGKSGRPNVWRGGLCLETQLYPNAMECYGFPSPVLRAETPLHSETSWSFRVR